jgi:hypothetical protein
MLQLDSTFSERTYGVNSFRDFAEKLASAGSVTLKESGRNVLVELKEGASEQQAHQPHSPQDQPDVHQAAHQQHPPHAPRGQHDTAPAAQPRMADAVAEVRRLFQAAQQPPRWPMYVRQVKQYLRGVDPTFDERKFGVHSLNDLLRACQRDGLFRVERDRQGVIRFFQGNVMKADEAAAASGINRADIEAAERLAQQAERELAEAEARQDVVDGDVVREVEPQPIVDVDAAPEESAAQTPAEESAKPSRRKRAPSSRGTKVKEPVEKKASRPRGGKRKVAVAADA